MPRQFVELLKRARFERMSREYGPALIVTAIASLGSKKAPDMRKFMPSCAQDIDQEVPWQVMQTTLGAAISSVGSN